MHWVSFNYQPYNFERLVKLADSEPMCGTVACPAHIWGLSRPDPVIPSAKLNAIYKEKKGE